MPKITASSEEYGLIDSGTALIGSPRTVMAGIKRMRLRHLDPRLRGGDDGEHTGSICPVQTTRKPVSDIEALYLVPGRIEPVKPASPSR